MTTQNANSGDGSPLPSTPGSANWLHGEGNKSIFWQGPRIGTCGNPVDRLRVSLGRVMAIDDLIVGYDGDRDGWSVGASFRTLDGDDFECRELYFIPREETEEDRFFSQNDQGHQSQPGASVAATGRTE